MYIQMYSNQVGFVWNVAKSERNLRERGFDFEFASLVFAGPTLERVDDRARRANRKERAVYEAAIRAQKPDPGTRRP